VVFTKLDILRDHQEVKVFQELEQSGEDMNDNEIDAKIDALVDLEMQDLCIKPLCILTESDPPKYPWVTTSSECAGQLSKLKSIYHASAKLQFKNTIANLVYRALKSADLEKGWIELAIAQRSNAKASIDASIR
jgi:hypothetical protein